MLLFNANKPNKEQQKNSFHTLDHICIKQRTFHVHIVGKIQTKTKHGKFGGAGVLFFSNENCIPA